MIVYNWITVYTSLTLPEYLIKSKYTKLEDKKLSHLEFHIVHTSEMSHEVIFSPKHVHQQTNLNHRFFF